MIGFEDIQTTIVVILAVCGGVAVVWKAYQSFKEATKPQEDRIRRLEVLENHDRRDHQRMKELEQASRLTLKAQMNIIDHLTTGNHTAQLNAVKDEIQKYLLDTKLD